MKKIILALFVLLTGCSIFAANTKVDGNMRNAIAKYNNTNYSGCIQDLKKYVQNKPTALAYYYLGMAYTNAGFKEDAIENYKQAIEYAQKERNYKIEKYAKLGKSKIENNETLNNEETYNEIDDIIKNNEAIPEELKEDLRKKHIEYLRNEMNSNQPPNF